MLLHVSPVFDLLRMLLLLLLLLLQLSRFSATA